LSDAAAQTLGRRRATARGTIINAAFQIGLGSLNFLKSLIAAGLLTAADYGVWGALFLAVALIVAIKTTGVSDKFIQQQEGDQIEAFQKAFTLELIASILLMFGMLLVAPLLALVYGEEELLAPGLVIAAILPAYAFQAPIWIHYRRMDFFRQRVLSATDPLTSFVVTLALAYAGLGYWSLVLGFVAGTWAAAVAAVVTSPYPLRLRYDPGTMRDYFSFSWPLVVAGASGLLIGQLSVLFGDLALGLAGAGAITLAATFAAYADRVDTVITQTIYPEVCRVAHDRALLLEAFTKSNRLTLMWGMPFGVGLTLFASDLIEFGIGEQWEEALILLQVFGLTQAFNHIGFNWTAFYRAVGETRPIARVVAATTVTFCLTALPLLLLFDLPGYAAGMAVVTVVTLALRARYVARLFEGFAVLRYCLRAVAPTVPAVGAVIAIRAVVDADRTLGIALGELAVYLAVTAVSTLLIERRLLAEAISYLRPAEQRAAPAGV
jgi:O-antigen/teichoic acid export membrane protein